MWEADAQTKWVFQETMLQWKLIMQDRELDAIFATEWVIGLGTVDKEDKLTLSQNNRKKNNLDSSSAGTVKSQDTQDVFVIF